MSILSNSSAAALANLYNGYTYDRENNRYYTNKSILNSISTKSASGSYCSFNSSSIFGNFGSTTSSQYLGGSYGDGLNRNKPYYNILTTIPTSVKDYTDGQYGSSLIHNIYNSLQSVALGQNAPTSVFEQRLNYTLPYSQQAKPGSMLGKTAQYFNTDTVASNTNSITGYNVFSSGNSNSSATANYQSNMFTGSSGSAYQQVIGRAINSGTTASLMSALGGSTSSGSTGSAYQQVIGRAINSGTTASLMSILGGSTSSGSTGSAYQQIIGQAITSTSTSKLMSLLA